MDLGSDLHGHLYSLANALAAKQKLLFEEAALLPSVDKGLMDNHCLLGIRLFWSYSGWCHRLYRRYHCQSICSGGALGIFVNVLGAGLPVVVMMHMIFIPRVAVLVENKLTVILLGGLFYSVFSLFDQGVDYSTLAIGLTSFTYVVMTQTLVGMGKATFTVVTGNPLIHFITLHVISARVPFDTRMYIEIFKLK